MFIGVRVNTELDQKLVYNSGFQTLPSKLLINILSLVVYLELCTELAPNNQKSSVGSVTPERVSPHGEPEFGAFRRVCQGKLMVASTEPYGGEPWSGGGELAAPLTAVLCLHVGLLLVSLLLVGGIGPNPGPVTPSTDATAPNCPPVCIATRQLTNIDQLQ